VLGAILYRIIIAMALRVDFLETGDMKLITAIIVIFSLVLPKFIEARKERNRKAKKMLQRRKEFEERGGDVAST
jgi:putative tryptophan/tyrosine transport system permease protein